jgi:hypothetical protein
MAESIKNKNYSLYGIALASVLLSLLCCPLFSPFFDDKEIFRYIGMVMYKGGVPYRDVFDHKPPLIYFLNEWAVWAGSWAFWLLDASLVLFATLRFFNLCQRHQLARPWFLPLLFNLLLRQTIVSFGFGMTREYTAIFCLLFFLVLMDEKKYKYYLLGILTGLSFFMQQDALLVLLPFFCYALFAKASSPLISVAKKTIQCSAGFLLLAVPVLAYFFLQHALGFFWEDAFAWNGWLFAQRGPFGRNLSVLKTALHAGEYDLTFYTALVLGLASIAGRHKRKWLLAAALGATGLCFAPQFLSGRLTLSLSFIYYLLPLAAMLPILVFIVFAGSEESFLLDKKAQFVFGWILSILLILGTVRTLFHLSVNRDGEQPISARSPFKTAIAELQYLEKQKLADYDLYVFYNANLVYAYNQFKILSPSKWIYHYFWGWYPSWDADGRILESITKDLQNHRTRFILDCSDQSPEFRKRAAYERWKSFVMDHYYPVQQDSSGIILWKIK